MSMGRLGILKEFAHFLLQRKKWLLAPLVILLLLMTLFILIAEIPVLTPFIYAIF